MARAGERRLSHGHGGDGKEEGEEQLRVVSSFLVAFRPPPASRPPPRHLATLGAAEPGAGGRAGAGVDAPKVGKGCEGSGWVVGRGTDGEGEGRREGGE